MYWKVEMRGDGWCGREGNSGVIPWWTRAARERIMPPNGDTAEFRRLETMNYDQSPKQPGAKGFETLSFAKRKTLSRKREKLARKARRKQRK